MPRCTPYRTRGLSISPACMDLAPCDLCPATGCDDPRRFASYACGLRGGACPVNGAVCS